VTPVGARDDVAVVGGVEQVVVADRACRCLVQEEVDRRDGTGRVGRTGCRGASHLEEGIGAALRLGPDEVAGGDVADAESFDCVVPVVGEFAIDVPGEDLEELGAADVVEDGVDVEVTIGGLDHRDVATRSVAFGAFECGDGVGEGFPGACEAFEVVEGGVHGVDHQLADPDGQCAGRDARVRGDRCHDPGLGDADLPCGLGGVPDRSVAAKLRLLDASMGFGTRELQGVFQPGLGREEPVPGERSCGVDVVGDRDAGGVDLTSQLLDAPCPGRTGGRVEPGRIDGMEDRDGLGGVFDHCVDPLRIDRRAHASRETYIGDRIESTRRRIVPEPHHRPARLRRGA
jgi:hypothetical protein